MNYNYCAREVSYVVHYCLSLTKSNRVSKIFGGTGNNIISIATSNFWFQTQLRGTTAAAWAVKWVNKKIIVGHISK